MAIDIRSNNFYWFKPLNLPPRPHNCGYCDTNVSSEKGFIIGQERDGSGHFPGKGLYICPNCKGPTFFTITNMQIPGFPIGSEVKHVPSDLYNLYNEARICYSNNCFTASVIVCRKMLMNISVEQGASEGLKFIEYVNYLATNGYIPPHGNHWVDHIRKKGNQANHEIKVMEKEDTKDILIFVEMLLKFIYEFPKMIPSPSP